MTGSLPLFNTIRIVYVSCARPVKKIWTLLCEGVLYYRYGVNVRVIKIYVCTNIEQDVYSKSDVKNNTMISFFKFKIFFIKIIRVYLIIVFIQWCVNYIEHLRYSNNEKCIGIILIYILIFIKLNLCSSGQPSFFCIQRRVS